MKGINIFIKLIHKIFHYNTYNLIKNNFIKIYSIWISLEFHEIGCKNIFNLKLILRGSKYIKIGNSNVFGSNCIITAWNKYKEEVYTPEIRIGNKCCFGEYNHITAINSITIGNNILTGRWVTITDNSHGIFNEEDLGTPPILRPLHSKGAIIIEDNVWIGDKATILPGVIIGRNSIIAANTVVTKNVPPFSIIAGVPGKIIKNLNN